jgi:hypothetical protein
MSVASKTRFWLFSPPQIEPVIMPPERERSSAPIVCLSAPSAPVTKPVSFHEIVFHLRPPSSRSSLTRLRGFVAEPNFFSFVST